MTPTKIAASALILSLAGTTAFAMSHAADMMGDYDADASGTVSADEFNTGFASGGTYAGMDTDASGTLSEDEYGMDSMNTTAFEDADTDASGDVSEEEYSASVFGGYDADASGDLDADEFGAVNTDFSEGGRFMMEDAGMEGDMEAEGEEATTTDG